MKFRFLSVGETFDFIGPEPRFNSFFHRCVKTSPREYRTLDDSGNVFGNAYKVGSIAVNVYHVKPVEYPDQLTCGCCKGPVEDRCCCHFHQDAPMGLLPHKCSRHGGPMPAAVVAEWEKNCQRWKDI